jgi:hypothetical protein
MTRDDASIPRSINDYLALLRGALDGADQAMICLLESALCSAIDVVGQRSPTSC